MCDAWQGFRWASSIPHITMRRPSAAAVFGLHDCCQTASVLRLHQHHVTAFACAVRELAPPGDVATAAQKPLTFEFRNVEMQNDSYRGLQVRCR
jgi:hypothetical protein